jgi:hypothetical protein
MRCHILKLQTQHVRSRQIQRTWRGKWFTSCADRRRPAKKYSQFPQNCDGLLAAIDIFGYRENVESPLIVRYLIKLLRYRNIPSRKSQPESIGPFGFPCISGEVFAIYWPTARSTLDFEIVHTIATALSHCKLDCCNSLYYLLPSSQLNQLQVIQKSIARAVTKTPRLCHINAVLRSLHWLTIKQRIESYI